MKTALIRASGLSFIIVVANFGYQLGTNQNWHVAIERTFFELVTVAVTVWVMSSELKEKT